MLAPWRKSYDKPRQCIKKQRHHFADKGSYNQSFGFSSCHVWMWEFHDKEGWVPKNRCFRIVVLKKTLESPRRSRRARRSNQSILKEISPEYSLEGLMLKLQYFGNLMRRADTLEKTLTLGKTKGKRQKVNRGRDGWTESPTQRTWVCENFGRQWRTGKPGVLQSMVSQRVVHHLVTKTSHFQNKYI